MSNQLLNQLFKPNSVAVIGASAKPGSPGNVVLRNLLAGKFLGPVMPVCEDEDPPDSVEGVENYSGVDTLPVTPDMAVICSSPDAVPDHLHELSRRGTRAVVLLSRGFFRFHREERELSRKALASLAWELGMRILGPNCLGYINPIIGLNASLAHRDALPGKIAFVSQSDSLFTAVLDWATSKKIGFSHFISLGDRYDIHFGHMLDYLNADPHTRAVLLYVETIQKARAFMSAARATARNKPVLVIKAGKSEAGAMAAAAHSGAYLGSDDVYDAAIRRAGMLRVFDVDSLFDTVETLARTRPLKGERLAILSNGGSPGFLATDALMQGNGRMAAFTEATERKLEAELGGEWSYWNPLVLKSNTLPEVYAQALQILLKDSNVDAVLAMHVPTAAVDSAESARALVQAAKKSKRNVLTSWLGIDDALEARQVFTDNGLPTFFTPEKAIRGFLSMVQHRRNQEMLGETPASLPEDFAPDAHKAREVIARALESSRQVLTLPEAMEILDCYDIPIVKTEISSDLDGVEGAVEAAEELGYPVALKAMSSDIMRKSQIGAVALDLETPEQVREAAAAVLDRLHKHRRDARVQGFIIQEMHRRSGAHELLVEVGTDPVFGPVIRFGQGGSLTEVLTDVQVALPPLNMTLAKECISRTRIYTLLQGYRDHPPVDMDVLCLTLIKISQMVVDLPEIFELEINPLFADNHGVLALDAQIRVAQAKGAGPEQLAIRPYPSELEECTVLRDGRRVHLRPIRPEDEPAHWEFLENVSAEDKRFRFFGNIGDLPRTEMTKLTQIDYDREMAFIARGPAIGPDAEAYDPAHEVTLGVVRAMTSPDNEYSEFAILIRSDAKRLGLGGVLMEKIIRYCRSRNTHRLVGQALLQNQGMAGLAEKMGFEVSKNYEDEVWDFVLYLNPS